MSRLILAAVLLSLSTASWAQDCVTDTTILKDLEVQKKKLDALDVDLKRKEQELAEREKAIAEQLKRLQEVKETITGIKGQKDEKRQERISKMVETFEKMSPKKASKIIEGLDEDLAVAAMSQISTQRLAKIMSSMNTKKSARLTELMTLGRKKRRRGLSSKGESR